MELRPFAKILIGTIGGFALLAAVWIGKPKESRSLVQDRQQPTLANNLPRQLGDVDFTPPSISPTGPYPKAVVDEMEFHFGAMPLGTSMKHTFTIRNEGEAPLVVKKGESTCKCTVGIMKDGQIAPGESIDVELEWKPGNAVKNFGVKVQIGTNDPDPKLHLFSFVVRGDVENLITVVPHEVWSIGPIPDDKPATITGTVYSKILSHFHLGGLAEGSGDEISAAEVTPLNEDELAKLEAKCGYSVKLTIKPEMQLGYFRQKAMLETDFSNEGAVRVLVEGYREGPIVFMPTAAGGGRWNPTNQTLSMGRFVASEGKKVNLLVYVKGMDDEVFQFLDVEPDLKSMQVQLAVDPKFQGPARRYVLTVEVPPGKPPTARGHKNPVIVNLKTNHSRVAEMKFWIHFLSQ